MNTQDKDTFIKTSEVHVAVQTLAKATFGEYEYKKDADDSDSGDDIAKITKGIKSTNAQFSLSYNDISGFMKYYKFHKNSYMSN
jgi:hypothetical protein